MLLEKVDLYSFIFLKRTFKQNKFDKNQEINLTKNEYVLYRDVVEFTCTWQNLSKSKIRLQFTSKCHLTFGWSDDSISNIYDILHHST